MSADFAVFRIGNDGSRTACGEFATFQAAQIRVQILAVSRPGEYVIVNKKDGSETSESFDRRKTKRG